jgi:hypothetical protein
MIDDISLNSSGDQDQIQHRPGEVGPGGMEVSQEPDDREGFYFDWGSKEDLEVEQGSDQTMRWKTIMDQNLSTGMCLGLDLLEAMELGDEAMENQQDIEETKTTMFDRLDEQKGEGWMTSYNLLESSKQLMQKLELESEEAEIAEETLEQ